jgi:hypothetical protein
MHRFGLFGHVNGPASAFTDLLQQFVTPYPVAGFFSVPRVQSHGRFEIESGGLAGRVGHEAGGLFMGADQGFNALAEGGIGATGVVKIPRSLVRVITLERFIEQVYEGFIRTHPSP